MRIFLQLFLASITLYGCGFKLRSTNIKLHDKFKRISIKNEDVNSQFLYKSLKELITLDGNYIIDNGKDIETLISISPVSTKLRQLAESNSRNIKEYEKLYTVNVTIIDKRNDRQIGKKNITVSKNIQIKSDDPVSNKEFNDVINAQAKLSLSQDILNYIKSL